MKSNNLHGPEESANSITVGFSPDCTIVLDPDDTDHSGEINAACNMANSETNWQSLVRLTAGRFRINSASVILHHFTQLQGVGWPMNPGLTPTASTNPPNLYRRASVFDVTYAADAAVIANGGSCLKDIYFNYPDQHDKDSDHWTAYPATIKGVSDSDVGTYAFGINLENLFGRNPYTFIDITQGHGNNYINRIIGTPFYRGIKLADGGDANHISNIHFTPVEYGWDIADTNLRHFIRDNAIGIEVARPGEGDYHGADSTLITSSTVFDYNIGYKFIDVNGAFTLANSIADTCHAYGIIIGGKSYGAKIVNCGVSVGDFTDLTDASGIAILLQDQASAIQICDCNILSMGWGIDVSVDGADLYESEADGPIIANNIIKFNNANSASSVWGIRIMAGDYSKIQGNKVRGSSFTKSNGIAIASLIEACTVIGNTVVGCDENSIYFAGHDGQLYGNMVKDCAAINAAAATGTVQRDGADLRVT